MFRSRSYPVYSANIAAGQYEPGLKASLGLKDLSLATEAAEQAGRSLPMLTAVHLQMPRLSKRVWATVTGRLWQL
nr:hypothetical protein [Paraburkholderia caribensis]